MPKHPPRARATSNKNIDFDTRSGCVSKCAGSDVLQDYYADAAWLEGLADVGHIARVDKAVAGAEFHGFALGPGQHPSRSDHEVFDGPRHMRFGLAARTHAAPTSPRTGGFIRHGRA